MVGITLQHSWANDPKFLQLLRERTGSGKCRFRIMVFHPESSVVEQRDREEADEFRTQPTRISGDALISLQIFAELRSKLPARDQAYLEVRAIRQTNLYCSIIRAGDRMLVTQYVMSRRGSKCPALEIAGETSPYFEMYAQEFERLWNLAVSWPPPVGRDSYE